MSVAVHRAPRAPIDRSKHADIVEAEVVRVVVGVGQRDACVGQHVLKRLQVERLAVGDDAVEVEHYGAQAALNSSTAASPARTGILSRFSRGGYGHS